MSEAPATALQPAFSIEKLYVKDLSIEVPNAPQIFLEREAPQVDIQLHHSASRVDEGIFESVLTVTVTAKVGEKTVFLVEAGQAGIFIIRNVPDADLEVILGTTCPNILFPYAREVISDAVSRCGFPPVLLNPVNFDAIYQAQKQAAQQQTEGVQAPAVSQTH